MIAASTSQGIREGHIRNMNLARDLDAVADLIERCFPIHLDQDGQTYIREMRKTAREFRLMGWMSDLVDLPSNNLPGFVWEEGGKILGNLTMIPFKNQARNICLIANVAVEPAHRRRGIARALTNHALSYLRRKGIYQVWLQVRDDNPAACQLYRSTGFVDQLVRTTWRIRPLDFKPLELDHLKNLSFSRRNEADWENQKRWLLENYPPLIRWNLPVDFSRFEPGFLQIISNFLDGQKFKHWGVNYQDETLGVITWQKTKTYANHLWLAVSEDQEQRALAYALAQVMKRLSGKHPLSIDYPKGRFVSQFEAMGFENFRSLIWMKQDLY
jgi:GNAT superfamily N-acetyltransferase